MNDRMKIICSEEKFIKIIIYYNTEILKKENSKATSEILKIIIKNIYNIIYYIFKRNFITYKI